MQGDIERRDIHIQGRDHPVGQDLSIVTWYSYIVLPTSLVNGQTIETTSITEDRTFLFGIVDNVNEDKSFDIDNSSLESKP